MEKILVSGNEAAAWGALSGGCEAFFGYPITPQNEITEWFSREFPKRGKIFVQSQSETASMNMLFGAASAGVRAMTSTSSPGWSLMLETMSHCGNAEIPCVVVLVSRGGPGMGTTQHSQMDFTSATCGGGHGGYKNIVLTPASIQEVHDLVARAFQLADKYRNPVIVLMDGILGHMVESLQIKNISSESLSPNEWALLGTDNHKDGKFRRIGSAQGMMGLNYPNYVSFMQHLDNKYKEMAKSELLYESYKTEDAELILIAFGYINLSSLAIDVHWSKGVRVGLFRPISVWPFPYERIKQLAVKKVKFLVVEDNLGQMIENVRMGAADQTEVIHLGVSSRHLPTDTGYILAETIQSKINEMISV